MSDTCCPPDEGSASSTKLLCPSCEREARSVSHETLYHLLEPMAARTVTPDQTYAVCRTRFCPVLYFSAGHSQVWDTNNARTLIGFKRSEGEGPHPVCYCFGYTEENIADEIDRTGESMVVEWITERVRAGECACEYKNPTGHCCLGDVRDAVERASAGSG